MSSPATMASMGRDAPNLLTEARCPHSSRSGPASVTAALAHLLASLRGCWAPSSSARPGRTTRSCSLTAAGRHCPPAAEWQQARCQLAKARLRRSAAAQAPALLGALRQRSPDMWHADRTAPCSRSPASWARRPHRCCCGGACSMAPPSSPAAAARPTRRRANRLCPSLCASQPPCYISSWRVGCGRQAHPSTSRLASLQPRLPAG